MELVTFYLDLYNKRRRKDDRLRYIPEVWREFYQSDAKIMSVYAGRGTGKSANIAQYVCMTENKSIIFVQNQFLMNEMAEKISILARQKVTKETTWDSTHIILRFSDPKKTVTITTLDKLQEYMWCFRDHEIIVDEFDNQTFSQYVNLHEDYLKKAIRFICVGSMYGRSPSCAKSWFKESDCKIYIDYQNAPVKFGFTEVEEEYFPSRYTRLIEHMPSLAVY